MGFVVLSFVESDATPQAIATPITLTASFVASDSIDVRNFSEVDWFMEVTNKASITRIDFQWEYADNDAPVASDWKALQVETIASGVSTPSTYELQQGSLGAVTFTIGGTTQVRGRRMRVLVRAGVGASAGSVIVLTALRRV
jgi:hypothetical protein